MAWCRQATSHYLSQCWPRSLSAYGITKLQWVNFWHRLHCWYITMEVPSMNLQFDKTHFVSSASIVKHPPVLHSWVDSLKSWYTSFLYWLWVQCGEIILLFCVTGEVAGKYTPCRCKETYMGTQGLIGNTAIPKLKIYCYRSEPKFANPFVL